VVRAAIGWPLAVRKPIIAGAANVPQRAGLRPRVLPLSGKRIAKVQENFTQGALGEEKVKS
jgi:hypothetical protein